MPYDPVCGKKVRPDSEHYYEFHGRTYYFCSEECRKEFAYSPGRYIVEKRESGGC